MQAQVIERGWQNPGASAFRRLPWQEPHESLAQLMDRLAVGVADVADADQWAIEVQGTKRTGCAGFNRLVPEAWLAALNHGQPAVYDVSFPLESDGRRLGVLHLSTLRPTGFCTADLAQGRRDAQHAASLLAAALR